jgi:hypothetical protein
VNVTVLLSSGDVDEWDDVDNAKMEMDLGGALLIYKKVSHTVTDEESKEHKKQHHPFDVTPPREGDIVEVDAIAAVYAPGMWMKFEVND